MENLRDQSEDENVFALVLRGSTERFDRQSGDRHPDVNEALIVEIGLDVIRIIKKNAAFLEKADVVLITMLIKRDQEIRFITRRKHFARAHAHLENRRPARDGGRDRHVSHDLLRAASSEPGEEGARALDAVLRISGETNDGVVDVLGAEIGAVDMRDVAVGNFSGFSDRIGWVHEKNCS